MKERKYTVYIHTCNENGKKYVGVTCQRINRRWGKNGAGYKLCTYFGSAINKYGWDNFNHEIVLCNLTKDEAEMFEIEIIKYYKTTNKKYGYNLRTGGFLKFSKNSISKEHREKISKALIERYKRIPYKRSVAMSEETRKKISLKNKGRVFDHSHQNKRVVNVDTGETFESIKEAAKKYNIHPRGIGNVCNGVYAEAEGTKWAFIDKFGKITQPKRVIKRRKRRVRNITTGIEFDCIKDANEFFDVKYSHISDACSGKRETCFGYRWEYIDN